MQTTLPQPTEGIYTHKHLVYPLEIDFLKGAEEMYFSKIKLKFLLLYKLNTSQPLIVLLVIPMFNSTVSYQNAV